jgi:hypothetical protein
MLIDTLTQLTQWDKLVVDTLTQLIQGTSLMPSCFTASSQTVSDFNPAVYVKVAGHSWWSLLVDSHLPTLDCKSSHKEGHTSCHCKRMSRRAACLRLRLCMQIKDCVGHNRTYAPYMTIRMVIPCSKYRIYTLYTHAVHHTYTYTIYGTPHLHHIHVYICVCLNIWVWPTLDICSTWASSQRLARHIAVTEPVVSA